MADNSDNDAGSIPAVAFRLMQYVIIRDGNKMADREEIFQLYARCRNAVIGQSYEAAKKV